jgi:uncharacterized SAM-binding protein YcdF (DUF218 family)
MVRNKNNIIMRLLIFVLIVILLIVSSDIWLPLPGTFLAVKDNIQNADCIVLLGGELYYRFKKTVELYNKGYSKNIVVSLLPESKDGTPDYFDMVLIMYGIKDFSQKELNLKAFKYFGKDSTNIYFTDDAVTSTYEEAVATRDFMLKKGFKSLILVTNTYHMRRALMLFRSVIKGTGIKIYHSAADKELYNPHLWWQKERDIKKIVEEYLAIVQNFIYHSVLKKKRTAFDTFY